MRSLTRLLCRHRRLLNARYARRSTPHSQSTTSMRGRILIVFQIRSQIVDPTCSQRNREGRIVEQEVRIAPNLQHEPVVCQHLRMVAWADRLQKLGSNNNGEDAPEEPNGKKQRGGGGGGSLLGKRGERPSGASTVASSSWGQSWLKQRGGRGNGPSQQQRQNAGEKATGLMRTVIQQVLQNSRVVAILQAVVLKTVLLPTSSIFMQNAIETGKEYYAAAKAKVENLGPPHCFVWNSLVETLETHSEVEMDEQGIIQEYNDHVGQMQDMVVRYVKLCRVSKTYKENVTRFQYSILPDAAGRVPAVISILERILEKEGAEWKEAVAPMGPRERALMDRIRGNRQEGDEAAV